MVKVIKSESKSGTVEKFKGGFGKMSETSKGKLKRNLIIAAAIVLIAGAICLNFVLFADKSSSQVYEPSNGTTQAPGQNTDSTPEEPESYFAMAQQNRASAYETAYNTLLAVTTSSTATEEAKENAFASITVLAANKQAEANIETLIKAKGFAECVAVLSDGHIDIVVKSDGLAANQRAQIQEIVMKQTNLTPADITIIERAS